jgi:hypothetical protein
MRRASSASATLLFLAVFLAGQSLGAFGQSRRANQTAQPTPTPSGLPKSVDTKPGPVIYNSDDKYELIFPTSREGTLRLKGAEMDLAYQSQYVSFIDQLNKAGTRGYRLISAIQGYSIGIVKIEEVQYEYSWFDTGSALFFKTTGFSQGYEQLSKQGFRLVDRFLIGETCETDSLNQDTCTVKEMFIVEREKGVEKPTQHILVGTMPRWKGNRSLELSAQIKQKIGEGFYPTKVLSGYEILLEYFEDKEDLLAEKPEVQVVRSSDYHNDIEQRVNELARQGYRLALVNTGIAVMYRRSDTATPVSYVWLDAKKKDFDKQLAQLQSRGAVYRITYPNKDGLKTKLVFELKAVDDDTRHEYRVLKVDTEETEDAAEKKVHIDLTPSAKETIKLMNSLVKEGFAVRDLFLTDKPSVLLERSR